MSHVGSSVQTWIHFINEWTPMALCILCVCEVEGIFRTQSQNEKFNFHSLLCSIQSEVECKEEIIIAPGRP